VTFPIYLIPSRNVQELIHVFDVLIIFGILQDFTPKITLDFNIFPLVRLRRERRPPPQKKIRSGYAIASEESQTFDDLSLAGLAVAYLFRSGNLLRKRRRTFQYGVFRTRTP
jgi:hypothetical protein